MKLDLHYVDPRLVELYDRSNARGGDTDFYAQLARDKGASVIVDFGCGTGFLARKLVIKGRKVIGVDPAPAMLAYARRQSGAEHVTWIEGDYRVLGAPLADLALMTGHVAQVFLEDDEWTNVLHALYTALRPGGHLAFESRSPGARAWERWNRAATYTKSDTAHGPLEEWLEVVRVGNGRVVFEGHNIFAQTGEDQVVESELRFRSEAELRRSLSEAGFSVQHVFGDWQRGPVKPISRELVFVARRE